MKKILYIVMALLAVYSCKHDIDYMLPEDALGFKTTLVDVPAFNGSYDFSVLKSGAGKAAANFTVAVADAAALENYNTENKTSYVALESSNFTLDKQSGALDVQDVFWQGKVTWNLQTIASEVREGNCVIPLCLTSGDLGVTSGRNLMLIHIVPVAASLDKTGLYNYYTQQTKPDDSSYSVENRLVIDAALASTDLEFSVSVDNSLVEYYNSKYVTEDSDPAVIVPDGVAILPGSLSIKAGETGVDFTCSVDVDALYGSDGKPVADEDWVIPVRVKCTTSDCVVFSEDKFFIRIVAFSEEEADPVGDPKEIWGPWDIIEGAGYDIVTEGKADWYGVADGKVEHLVDGLLTTEWWSPWDTPNEFPITFVFDMKEQHIFDMLYIADGLRFQGQFRNYRFSVAKSYKEENTKWTVISEGRRGYEWLDKVNVYDCPVTTKAAGRYLKFEILSAEWNTGDYHDSHGRLAEIYGHGI